MTRRRGFGLVLGLVLVLLAILSVGLMAQGSLTSGVFEAIERGLCAEESAVLAESALEEALAHIALEANGGADGRARGPLYTLFRGASQAAWDPQLGFSVPLSDADLPVFAKMIQARPLHQQPAPAVTARVRFQRFFDASGFEEHDERFGTLELSATVPARGGARCVTRWYEFRVVRTALPVPYDRTPFHVQETDALVNAYARLPDRGYDWANDVMRAACDVIERTPQRVDALIADLGRLRDEAQNGGAGALAGQLDRVLAELARTKQLVDRLAGESKRDVDTIRGGDLKAAPLRPFGFPFVLYLLDPERAPDPARLDEMNLPAFTRQFMEAKRAADEREKQVAAEWMRLLNARSTQVEGPGIELAQAMAARMQTHRGILLTYRDFQRAHFEQGGEAKLAIWNAYRAVLDEASFKPLGAPPAGGTVRLRGSKASFIVGPAELAAVLDRYGPAFTGAIYVDNAGGPPLVLDGKQDPRWHAFAGRLVLAVGGDCTLREVRRADATRDLLTVVCYGTTTLAGDVVEASVAARGRFQRGTPRAVKLVGNLLLGGPAFGQGDADQVLAGITIQRDPLARTGDAAGRGPHTAVLFGPDAVYTNALRQVQK